MQLITTVLPILGLIYTRSAFRDEIKMPPVEHVPVLLLTIGLEAASEDEGNHCIKGTFLL